jgi:LmbE family N-acetylglucosaminyl deacetylase
MMESGLVRTMGIVLCAAAIHALCVTTMQAQKTVEPDAYLWNNRPPDPRFKADILVVVAHPDDETMVTPYLAREIHDNHKRVAVVFGTRGEGSNNYVSPDQSIAMRDIREIEGREAVGSLGITNVWFLPGHDNPNQNVLTSLERWGDGECLEELIRIVRLTRPSVILTFLPDFTTG